MLTWSLALEAAKPDIMWNCSKLSGPVVRDSEAERCGEITDRTTYSGGTTACMIRAAIGTVGDRQVLGEIAILEHKVGH